MEKFKSLADALGLEDHLPAEEGRDAPTSDLEPLDYTTLSGEEFCKAVVDSTDFRRYVVNGLKMGDVPGFASILNRVMDRAWGKTPDRVEVTGKDGQPIQTVTEVRRVVIHVAAPDIASEVIDADGPPRLTH